MNRENENRCFYFYFRVFGEDLINRLCVSDWKERFAGMTEFFERTKTLGGVDACPLQVLCRIVLRKPGLKDTNVQVSSEEPIPEHLLLGPYAKRQGILIG